MARVAKQNIPVHKGMFSKNYNEIAETNSNTLACVQATPSPENRAAQDHSG